MHAASAACEEAFWHPDFAASLARLQLALNVGDRTFWNHIYRQLPDIVSEVEPHALSDIAHAAAALGLRHELLWGPVATAIDAMSLQMTPVELDVALRALVASRPQLSPEVTDAVRLHTLLEVVQWRCSCGRVVIVLCLPCLLYILTQLLSLYREVSPAVPTIYLSLTSSTYSTSW